MADKGWKEQIGLAEDTDQVIIYCKCRHKDEWTREAEEKGYSSRSKYLYELIMEARRAREDDFFTESGHSGEEEELRERIDELHDEIGRLKKSSESDTELVTPDVVMGELDENYRSLDDLVASVLQSDRVSDYVRKEVEAILYDLIDTDRAQYQMGHGWRHVPEGDA
ncbi:hypothetical protein [Halopenitus sp. POP-27]|uniref:hypothetical protein n=1 Tax=Halopenitus sp. POP-27 TaxID=2994425 RepID=UPI0024696167|nr:hypothetical protein [Halopenitus sp. POP-27]